VSERPALHALAERIGVERRYESALDHRVVEVPDATLERLVEALGHDAHDEAAAARALERIEAAHAGDGVHAGRPAPPGSGVERAHDAGRSGFGVEQALGAGARGFGVQANVYALRGGLGHGDLGDLRALCAFTARNGGCFVAVKATAKAPDLSAALAMSSGPARSARRSQSRALEMSQFWQNLQPRLQPAVPKDRTGVPGRKWLSGFFSIGSMQNPVLLP